MNEISKNFCLLILCSCCVASAMGQNALLFPHLENVQQVLQRNPAKPIDAKVSVALGSAFLGYRNGLFKYGNYDDSLPILPQVEAVVREHDQLEKINLNARADLLGVSVLTEAGRFSLGVAQRVDNKLTIPDEFTNYIFFGDEYLQGSNLEVRNLNAEVSTFVEVALRYQSPLRDDGLSFGGSLKFLGGQSHGVLTDAVGRTTNTTATDTFLVEASGRVRSSGIAAFGSDTTLGVSHILRKPNNFGLGIDAGIFYQADDTWSFGLSILDLGFIRWKRRIYDAEFGASFRSVGVPTIVSTTGDIEELANNIDELIIDAPFPSTMAPTSYGERYTRAIKPSVLGTVNAQISNAFSLGASYGFDADSYRGEHSIGLNASVQFGDYVQALAGYSFAGPKHQGLGFGTALALGPLQVYATVDNVLELIEIDKLDGVAVNVGANLIFPMVWFGGSNYSKGMKSKSKQVKCYKF